MSRHRRLGEPEEVAGDLRDAGGGGGHRQRLQRVHQGGPHPEAGRQKHLGHGEIPLPGESRRGAQTNTHPPSSLTLQGNILQ